MTGVSGQTMTDQAAPREAAASPISIKLYIIPLLICVLGIGLFLVSSLFKDINLAQEVPDMAIDNMTSVVALWSLILMTVGFLVIFFITTMYYSVKTFQPDFGHRQDHEKEFLASSSIDDEFDKKKQMKDLIKEIDEE